MKNNYRILIINNDNLKNFKIDNKNIYKDKYFFINRTAIFYAKLIIVILLLFIMKSKLHKLYFDNNNIKQSIKQEKDVDKKNRQNKNYGPNKFWNYTFLKNEMHYYGLYNSFKFPLLTIIIMNNEKTKQDKFKLINYIKSINFHNFINAEIIFYIEKDKKKIEYLFINQFKKIKQKDVLKIYKQKNNIKEDYYNLINLSKGLYTMFINNYTILNDISINQILNYTKNNIKNYINLKISNEQKFVLIKTKILKDLNDNGNEFTSINNILDSIKPIQNMKINYIHISLCPDNAFTNLAYVTMTSILDSKSTNTFILFYLIIPDNFDNHNIKFMETLHEVYDYFNITYIRMDKRYDHAYTDHRITKQAYYRFSLGELLPNLNKIIYFDTDNIIYKDLTKFYNLNFNGKMILGQPSYGNKNAQRRGFHRINTGVLLLNLLEMRKNEFEKKVIEITKKRKKLRYHDQTLINDYFKQFLGIFAPEYHARPWSNINEMKIFEKKIGNVFDLDYFYFAHKYPTIRHFLGSYKPLKPNINFIEDWWYFARKSKYYNPNATTYKNAFSYK